MSLRKEKAARLKLAVLEQTLKLIGRRPFEDLFVEDICARVKISKVTLFKYFPVKEDIFAYYFRIWCLRRMVELKEKPREGVSGVTYLFDKLSEDFDQHPGIFLSLVAYLSSPKRPPKPFPLKAEEKKLLFPDQADIHHVEIMSIEQLFEKFALEGVFKKEFKPLKPILLVHAPSLKPQPVMILDLVQAPELSVQRSLRADQLPRAVLEELTPQARYCYFFERAAQSVGIEGGRA